MMDRHKINIDLAGDHLNVAFRAKHPGLGYSEAQVLGVVRDISSAILNLALEGYDVKLPYNMGTICIRSMPALSPLVTDWKATRQYKLDNPDKKGKRIYFNNSHTGGKIVKFLWLKEGQKITNKQFYILKFPREPVRELARRLKDPDISLNYYDFESWQQKLKQLNK